MEPAPSDPKVPPLDPQAPPPPYQTPYPTQTYPPGEAFSPAPAPAPAGYPAYPQQPAATAAVPGTYPLQPAPTGGTSIVVTAPTIVVGGQSSFGHNPVHINCPHCHADIVTTTTYEVGAMAWMICGIIVLVGVFLLPCVLLGCCFIPFCIKECKDVVHQCPNCKQTLAHVSRFK